MPRRSTGLLVRGGRSIPVRGVMTKSAANACIARLLVLASEGPQQPILANVAAPSGLASEALRIISTMDGIRCPVATFALGKIGGAATLLVAHGRRGFRVAAPTAQVLFTFDTERHEHRGTTSHLRLVLEMLARDSQQPEQQVLSWFETTAQFTPEQALANGLVDQISGKPVLPVWGDPGLSSSPTSL